MVVVKCLIIQKIKDSNSTNDINLNNFVRDVSEEVRLRESLKRCRVPLERACRRGCLPSPSSWVVEEMSRDVLLVSTYKKNMRNPDFLSFSVNFNYQCDLILVFLVFRCLFKSVTKKIGQEINPISGKSLFILNYENVNF